MEISYEYIKKRKEFGQHPRFEDVDAYVMESIVQNPEAQKMWVPRQITSKVFDCNPRMAEHNVNTERFVQKDQLMFHTEGGWPKEVNSSEFKERERHLRRVENEDSFRVSTQNLVCATERCIMQNNSIDVYEEYFAGIHSDHSSEPPSAKTLTVFRDPNDIKRSTTSISWHPDGPNKLAVSYSIQAFQQMPENTPVFSYIWDVNNPNNPLFEIVPPSPLCTIVYNPKTTDYLVGGSYNGLISFWDIRKGSQPVEQSVIEKSHHDPIYDISWIQSRSGNECCSVSTDGQVLWWDIRKLASGPTDSMVMIAGEDEIGYGGSSLEYRSDAGATRFLVGTEEGVILNIERKAKKDFESQKSVRNVYGEESGRHHGPIYSIARNPFNLKFFMTVGDWTAKIWMEDLKAPILSTRYERSYLTSGCWSPTRPGVFYTTKLNGTLDMWDFFYKQNDPVYSTKVCESGLSAINVQSDGRLIAVGALDGSTTLLQVCNSLAEPQNNEKQSIAHMFERENKREKNLEMRAMQQKREKKKQQMKEEGEKTSKNSASKVSEDTSAEDEELALINQVEKEFYEIIESGRKEGQIGEEESDFMQ